MQPSTAGSSEAIEYLRYLQDWMGELPSVPFAQVLEEAGGAGCVALFCVDMINGFCREGPLHSAAVAGLIEPITRLLQAAYDAGVRNFVFPQDAHVPDALEFRSYPPHCMAGSSESATVAEIAELPFHSLFTVLPKNSIHSAYGTGLDSWLDSHAGVTHRIVVGDCTDLCTYQLAMHLHLRAIAAGLDMPVIVPANCVQTYNVPVSTARGLSIPAHSADLLQPVFLYNMACNGVRIVSAVL